MKDLQKKDSHLRDSNQEKPNGIGIIKKKNIKNRVSFNSEMMTESK